MARVIARDWRVCVSSAEQLTCLEAVPESSSKALRRMSARIFDRSARPRPDVFDMVVVLSSCWLTNNERKELQALSSDLVLFLTSHEPRNRLFYLMHWCNFVARQCVLFVPLKFWLTEEQQRCLPSGFAFEEENSTRLSAMKARFEGAPPIVQHLKVLCGKLGTVVWPVGETRQSYLEELLAQTKEKFGVTTSEVQTSWMRCFPVPPDFSVWTWHSFEDETLRVIAATFDQMIRGALSVCPYEGDFPAPTYQPPGWSQKMSELLLADFRLSRGHKLRELETKQKQILSDPKADALRPAERKEPQKEDRKRSSGPLRALGRFVRKIFNKG